MSEIATTGTVLTEEDVKERVDVGIAFLVLLFMGGLGAYLMSSGDTDGSVLGDSAEPTAAVAGGITPVVAAPGTTGSVFEERAQERAQERAVAQAPVETAPVQSVQSAVSNVDVIAAQPRVEAAQEVAEPIFEPVVEPTPEPLLPQRVEQIVEPVVEEPVEAEMSPQIEATVSEQESALLKLATDSVSFVTGSAVLTEQSTRVLDDIGALLRSRPNSRLSVIGYTDSQGDPDENVALSFARAEACRDYLLGQGAKVGQVDSAGMGARRPIGDNATPEGRRANRRVEFTLLKGN